ncbi:MAG: SBBP repeat-containing protein, partial [Acidobacteria bacterium]|nr:SBBP repeat-containing protein [Acidobacteriota bacterium]
MDDFFTQLSSQERVEALMRKRPLMILCDRLIPFGAIAILSISTALAEQAGRVSDRPSANAGLDSSFRKAGAAELAGPLKAAFEANVGQTDPQVRFLSRGRGAQLFLTSEEAVLKFGPSRDAVLRMRLLGANVHAQLEGMEPLLGHSNYFTGSDPRNWHTSVSQFAKVLYRDVYPGIDLAYHSTGRDFEYDFILEPGRSPQAITVDFVGAADLRMDAGGNLVLSTAAGDVYHKKPVAYQLKQDRRIFVEAAYVLKGRRSAGFRLGHYDPSLPLVIDPVLSFSGYQGGTGLDQAYGIAVDAAGNSYITGTTESINFPLQSQFAPYPNDNRKNAFVMKLNPQGTTVLYSTYLGGNADDEGLAIAVDSSGQALVAGYTDSTNFPTASPYRATNSGGRDGFVARLNATGNALVYSTYLGGSGSDLAFAIALDGQSNVYVAGSTASTSFPTVNPYQATLGALRDAFVTKFNPAGST